MMKDLEPFLSNFKVKRQYLAERPRYQNGHEILTDSFGNLYISNPSRTSIERLSENDLTYDDWGYIDKNPKHIYEMWMASGIHIADPGRFSILTSNYAEAQKASVKPEIEEPQPFKPTFKQRIVILSLWTIWIIKAIARKWRL